MRRISIWVALFFLMTCSGNAQEMPEIPLVGIVADDATFSRYIEWFKSGMVHFGYVEGRDVRYTFYGFVGAEGTPPSVNVEAVLSDDPDIVFALGNFSALWAKGAVTGTDISAVFAMISSDPIRQGLVETLGRPRGNITGIRVADSVPKALEWLVAAVPGIKRIFLPYDPADEISVLAMRGLADAAPKLGVELVVRAVGSVEEAVAAIETAPDDIGAIFRIPSRTFELQNMALSRAAGKRNLPAGAAVELDQEVLVSFSTNDEKMGRQAARLVKQIFQGVNPADLPIETSEVFLTINLKIAEKMGVHVPDDVLVNANTIIR